MDLKRQAKGSDQISKARGNIDYQIRSANEELFSIKMKNDNCQKDTRYEEENKQLQRAREIEGAFTHAKVQHEALLMKLDMLLEVEECEELSQALTEQKDIFAKIINTKDGIIAAFVDELNRRDDEFGKLIKDQALDIQTLIKRMRLQFFELRERIEKELEAIEGEFIDERNQLLASQQGDVKKLFEQHTNMEKQFVEERDKNEEEYTKKIEQLRIEGLKSYAELKISMETEIQNLEKCFEDMKALYQLNTEKLDYNLKVLKEKQTENTHLQDELKRKDQNLNYRLRNLIKDFNDFDVVFKQKNKELTQEYKRITRQFKELQRKFKHFDKADQKAYNDIQQMNELGVKKLKDKILKCDQTIHIQQLGIEWEEPPDQKDVHEQSQQVIAEEEVHLPISEDKLQEMVDLLIQEVDFLIDDKLGETIIEANEGEQLGLRLNVIKKCLNIDSIDEMIIFIELIIKDCRIKNDEQQSQEVPDTGKQHNPGGKHVSIVADQPLLEEVDVVDYENFKLNQNLIVDFLIKWMNQQEQRKLQIEKMSSRRAAKQETERQKKERIAKEGKKYWEKLTQVLPERTFHVWRILDKQLTRYYDLLLERQKLIDETGQIHNHNEELKNLLNQYLQINHELIIPPTRFLKLEQQEQLRKQQ